MIRRIKEIIQNKRKEKEERVLNELKSRYHAFRIFLGNNGRALELIGLFDSALASGDDENVRRMIQEMRSVSSEMADSLNMISSGRHNRFYKIHQNLFSVILKELANLDETRTSTPFVIPLSDVQPGHYYAAGSKASTLARLKANGLPVPDGFVVTVPAFRRILENENLTHLIRQKTRALSIHPKELSDAAESLTRLILTADFPKILEESLVGAFGDLKGKGGAVSVRSSALAEDKLSHSFAGQFESVLNIKKEDDFLTAYRMVLASCFNDRVLAYRMKAGLTLADTSMAVLCQQMVDARTAGLVLTKDPSSPDSEFMMVTAVPGLGTSAVGGTLPADLFRPNRNGIDPNLGEAVIAPKEFAEILAEGGGLKKIEVSEGERGKAVLSGEELTALVRLALRIENLEGSPQEIEWAMDKNREFHILQSRPLRISDAPRNAVEQESGKKLATGTCASPGKAVGRTVVVRTVRELEEKAEDGGAYRILLLHQSIVDAARYLNGFDAVIVDMGNPADHLSCIAREYAVPMVTGTLTAVADIPEGAWVVVDADSGSVHEAAENVWEANGNNVNREKNRRKQRKPMVLNDPAREGFRQKIVPLHLTNAYGAIYSTSECRSFHDFVRLAHENAVLAMFSAGDNVMDRAGGLLKKIDIGVPFRFLAIDLGGGLDNSKGRSTLRMDDIRSSALSALCRGLTTPGLSWHSQPGAGAVSSLISNTLLDGGSSRPAGEFNYALVAKDYLNLNARVEFHFAMLDASCTEKPHANYIRFRLKGGGTGYERGQRRALFVLRVLEAYGFSGAADGDLVTASLAGAPQDIIEDRLVMIGRLIGFSRLLDGVMDDDDSPDRLAESFLQGRFDRR